MTKKKLDYPKIIAYDVIFKLSPDEIDGFEFIWEQYNLEYANSSNRENELGSGILENFDLISSIVIPLVVALSKDLIKKSVEELFKFIKEKLNKDDKRSDEEIKKIAELLIKSFEEHKLSEEDEVE